MSSQSFSLLLLQLATMLACAILFGQLLRRFGQPAVLGEMVGGIILGPTIFGALSPAAYSWLFHGSATVTTAREASVKLGMLFFMFLAGMQVNLSQVRRLGARAAAIGLAGTLLPLAVGVALVYLLPRQFWGRGAEAHLLPFALFIGMNLANSSNSVIARILMDLNLLKTEIGALVMTATIVDDFVNWTVFAIVLNQIRSFGSGSDPASLPMNIVTVLTFFVVILGAGRWLAPRALRWMGSRIPGPTGVIAAGTLAMLLASSFAEWAGAHAFLGAFLVGAAFGNGNGEPYRRQETMAQFVSSFFAPLYFVSMGLTVNFVSDFHPALVAIVLLVACASKFAGVLLGARMVGMALDRRTIAVGFGLNARGATGVVLAGIGLEYGLIDTPVFVALIVMSVVTALIAGPALKRLAEGQPVVAGS